MKILVDGLLMIAVALGVHVLWWRIRLPKNQMGGLLKIFVSLFVLWAISMVLLNTVEEFGSGCIADISVLEGIYIAFFYFAMALTYTLAYSAIEADSPSLTIVRIISESPGGRIRKDDLYGRLDFDRFLEARVRALLIDRMLLESGGRYTVTRKGYMAARIVVVYRRVMGVKDELG